MPTPAHARPPEQHGLQMVGHSDLDGRGDGMQVMRNGDVLYVGHMGDFGVGTSVVDLADPTHPRLASRWWWPGQHDGDGERLADDSDVSAHHVIVRGDRAYGGYFDAGVVVYAVKEDGTLDFVSSLSWAERSGDHPHTH